jgi:hypothetical protein
LPDIARRIALAVAIVLTIVVVICLRAAALEAQQKNQTFAIPGAVLLFGDYNELRVVTPEGTQVLTPPSDQGHNRSYFVYPDLSQRGDAVAWGFATGWHPKKAPGDRARFALGLYGPSDQKWKTYGDLDFIGDVAFSPDASKVAFVARQDGKTVLLVFDRETETFTAGSYKRGMQSHPNPSWSPDGTRLAVEVSEPDKDSVIATMDVRTGQMHVLVKGARPRWGPTGEWIAYFFQERCFLIRPDGTGRREVAKAGWGGEFIYGSPVWSPDGRQLLLNVNKDETRVDVVLVDLTSRRKTTKSRRGLPVYGWAAAVRDVE